MKTSKSELCLLIEKFERLERNTVSAIESLKNKFSGQELEFNRLMRAQIKKVHFQHDYDRIVRAAIKDAIVEGTFMDGVESELAEVLLRLVDSKRFYNAVAESVKEAVEKRFGKMDKGDPS